MKYGLIASLLAIAALTSSCVTTSVDTQAKATKVYDTVCPLEPTVYATFLVVANRVKAKDSVLKAAADAHVVVVHACANRPTDLVSGAATLLAAYNQIVNASSSI